MRGRVARAADGYGYVMKWVTKCLMLRIMAAKEVGERDGLSFFRAVQPRSLADRYRLRTFRCCRYFCAVVVKKLS